jgi:hypothetical protein
LIAVAGPLEVLAAVRMVGHVFYSAPDPRGAGW